MFPAGPLFPEEEAERRKRPYRRKQPPVVEFPRTPKTLGDHLKKRRLELRLYIREVARMTGINLASLQRYEKNRGNPTPKMVAKIVQFLGYNPLAQATSLGERMRRVRVSAGFTIRQLADYLGVDSGSLSRWETESRVPFAHHLQLLEAFLQRFEKADGSLVASEVKSVGRAKLRSFNHPLTAGRPPSLGQLIFKKRMELGMSQSEVGKLLEVGRGAVWHWEEDAVLPNHRYMPSVIRFLGCLPIPSDPGRRHQLLRLAIGVDCMEFERRFKIGRPTLYAWENGKAVLPEDRIARLEHLADADYPVSEFPRVKIATLALRTRRRPRQ